MIAVFSGYDTGDFREAGRYGALAGETTATRTGCPECGVDRFPCGSAPVTASAGRTSA
ncbi:hypothetical protein B0I33_107276 [Prauserella shujinwangii]|uniref:Uncharacterized protein n=1 Tax=Prauserella shujinwangii TaxID=1453103 RepID=A0A2T0LSQ2_9PSEU|nr:hypothetical protein B0I33_107276 [Prauserella shujinwangii]